MTKSSKAILEYHQRAVKLLKDGNLKEAEELYIQLLGLDPKFISAYNNLGIILRMRGDLEGAKKCYQTAIMLNPQYFQGYSNLGNIFKLQIRFNEAEESYRKALKLNPNFPDAHNNLGGTLQLLGRLEEAAESYEKAIKIDPGYMDAYGNLGGVLLMMGKIDQAEICLRAVENTTNMPEPIYNLANLMKEKGDLKEAVRLYKKVIRQKADYSDAYNGLLDCLKQLCEWKAVKKVSSKLDVLTKEELIKEGRTGETPYTAISRLDDPLRNLQIASSWSRHIKAAISTPNPGFYFDRLRKTHSKIRIGYLSRDFTDHPIGHIIKGLFAKHDRRKFEVYCFFFGGNRTDHYRRKIEKGCDHFVDISSMSFLDTARRIHAEEIDILIDLMGHTSGNRLEIMALRPSPIQISYLGFLASTGADFIDYQIVDRTIVPEDMVRYYTEQLIYLPGCYQINDSHQKISTKSYSRVELGLPANCFVFCSFNRLFKITPELFDSWTRILSSVPNSVLWLQGGDPIAEENLRAEAEKRVVDPKRIVFSQMIPLEEHLKRLQLADLMLDTHIYSGGATTSHALRMGIPVITISGKTYLSRMSTSLLNAVGMEELVTHSPKEYEALAISLAKDPTKLKAIKEKLKKNSSDSKLFDTTTFVKNLELAYKEVWGIYKSGQTPHSVEVTKLNLGKQE